MNWKYIQNIDKSKDFAEMFIYDEISDEKINGASFAYEMRYLVQYEGIKKIKVKINSVGGNVMHAQTIISEILDAKEKGVIIETYGQGLMASSAGVIWLTAEKKHRYSKDFARLMIHGVSPVDQKNLTDNDRNALENFKKTLVQILANRTGKKEAFFEELFTNGKDNWFDVKEMVKLGFIAKENIEETDVKIELDTTAGVAVVYNKLNTTIENINKNEITMKKVIARLGLQEAASEEAVDAAVLDVQNKLKIAEEGAVQAKNKLTEAEAEVVALKAKIEVQNKAAAADYVKQCVKEGKIAPEKEADVLVQAENSLEGFKAIMDAMPAKAVNILNQIGKNEPAETTLETRSFRELEKEAPAVLENMLKTDIKQYVNLYNMQYKTQKTEADFQ